MRTTASRTVAGAILALLLPAAALAAAPVEIRIGHGFAAEEQLWLMRARPDLTPGQGKAYTLKLTPFRASATASTPMRPGRSTGGPCRRPRPCSPP